MPEIINQIINFSGLGNTDNPMHSFGHICINFGSLTNKFHIIPNFDFPYDSIIGNDFLSISNSKIDYTENILVTGDKKLNLKFTELIFTIPPRTETVIECSVTNPEMREELVLDQQPIESLLIANCMFTVKSNNRINISVIIISEYPITIDSTLKLNLTSLNTSDLLPHEINTVSHCNKLQNVYSRTNQVIAQLRISHLNLEETLALHEACAKFSDIFYLPGDKLSFTNASTHQIKTTYSAPIHTKLTGFPNATNMKFKLK